MLDYKIRAGDTLSKIAKRFNVGVDAIVQCNGIRNPDRIRVGQKLKVPASTTDAMDAVVPSVAPPPPPPDGFDGPPINRGKFVLLPKEYIGEVKKKDLIVLHFTAGTSAKSTFETWKNNPVRVATCYTVDPDGSIYELFDPAHWAFHLGVKGSNGKHDKRSIGIEIANVGPLKIDANKPDQLNWWPREWGTRWCRRDETSKYVPASYRGIDFFVAFPDEQLDAVGQLVRHLCERFEIRRKVPAKPHRGKCDLTRFGKFTGVASHQNFRKDKWDIGPAFDWDRLGL